MQLPTDGHDRLRQLDTGGTKSLGRARGQQSVEVVAWDHRLQLRRPGRDRHVLRLDVEHPGRGPGDHGGAGEYPHDVMRISRIAAAVSHPCRRGGLHVMRISRINPAVPATGLDRRGGLHVLMHVGRIIGHSLGAVGRPWAMATSRIE
jgi:hypothetical protein